MKQNLKPGYCSAGGGAPGKRYLNIKNAMFRWALSGWPGATYHGSRTGGVLHAPLQPAITRIAGNRL